MFHVICSLPNASHSINGVEFMPHSTGVITSEPVEVAVASKFLGIPGYSIVDAAPAPPPPPAVRKVRGVKGGVESGQLGLVPGPSSAVQNEPAPSGAADEEDIEPVATDEAAA